MKPLEPPQFSEKIREYPTFCKDYERFMQSTYGEDPYALKQCLMGESSEVIKCVEEDYKQMLREWLKI